MQRDIPASAEKRSPSSRRAWIEIKSNGRIRGKQQVALLAEGVDRNMLPIKFNDFQQVALLAEGVDRNKHF